LDADGKVVSFRPNNGQNVDNIPHMLRYWADRYESGAEPMPVCLVMVELSTEHARPEFAILGKAVSQLTLLGLLQACTHRVGHNLEPKED